ncbi:MAG: serine/threonine-protein kinase [Burkholderiales bacterium]
MTPEDLARLSTLLDEALALDASARERWLAALPGDARSLEPTLRRLLARQAAPETGDILDRPPFLRAPDAGADHAFAPGETVGPYRLLRELGRGGMGEVWQAERADGTLKRKVALKLPHVTWAPGLPARFAREREILASLEHPNIARLYDAGFDAHGRPYMALEYVEGLPIDEYCRRRALPVEARLRLLLQVADAVAFAHSRLVVHRDLKPGNILVTGDGQVRLLDFGIAKLMEGDSAQETALTRASGRALTLDYASPEQIRGEAIGTSSDVYALGVVAFELVAGARPYRLKRGTAAELEEAIAVADVPLASEVAADPALRKRLQGDLDAILNKALKKAVADRYPTVDALAQDWRRHLDGQAVTARPDTLAYRVNRALQRHRVPAAAAAVALLAFGLAIGVGATAVVILALLLGLGVALWQARQAARARDRALALNARNEAVTEFLNTLLTQAARSGEALTAEQLLARSEALIEREFKDNPEHRAAVLAMMGMNSHSLGNPARAVALMERALAATRDAADQSLRDKLVIEHALAIAWIGRIDEAWATLSAVVARPSTQPDDLAEAHHYMASLAHQRSDAAAAMHHATEALRCLRLTARPSARMEASLIASLGHSCHVNGRNDEADRHYADAFARMERLGQERNPNAIAMLNNWAIVNEGAGDVRKALALYDRALDIATTDAPDAPKSPIITVNRARALELVGRLPEAAAAYEEGLQLSRDQMLPPGQQFALLGMASLALERGDAAEAARHVALGSEGPAATPGGKVALLRAQVEGRLALLRGDADAATAQFTSMIGERPPTAATVVGLLGRADAHGAAGRRDAAVADVDDALALAQALQGTKPHSLRTGLAALALARLHRERGDLAATRAAAGLAATQLAGSVDPGHAALAAARRLADVAAGAATVA